MARGLCLYRLFILTDIPPAERKNVLNVRILQWSPFSETGQYVAWIRDAALVWIWDEGLRRSAMLELGISSATAMPESVLLPHQIEMDGPQLVPCREGYEGQIWQGGLLTASHWWERPPSAGEWARFLVANDVTLSNRPEPADSNAWLARPWGKRTSGLMRFDVRNERQWIVVGVLLFSMLFIWQATGIWRWSEATNRLRERIDMESEKTRPLRSARSLAIDDKDTVERLLSIATGPSPLVHLAAVAENMPRKDITLCEWRWTRNRLSVFFAGKNLDPLVFIETYQRLPGFHDVVAEKAGNERLVVHVNLHP